MARREVPEKLILTTDELAALRKRLSQMSVTGLEDFYRAAHFRCGLRDGSFPRPRDVQELVTAWKELRRA